jgi:hypothetical protein
MDRAFGALHEWLESKRDPRAMLWVVYVNYRDWREAAGRLAATLGKELAEVETYDEWRRAEEGFAAELERKLSPPSLRSVRNMFEHFERQHGRLCDPPPLRNTAELGDYGQMVRRLAATSADEDRFLDLFCAGDVPAMIPEQESTWLDSAVYRAAEKLAKDGVFNVRRRESEVTFTLTSVAHRAWLNSQRTLPSSTSVPVDERAVRATIASGSGA